MEGTLDIPEVQVIVNFPADGQGFTWHHRILLQRVEGAVWICLTPDHELVKHDLNALPHRVLDRKSSFPDELEDVIYAHDAIGRSVLNGFKRRAKIQATILGQGEVGETEAYSWLIAEISHSRFGEMVEESLLSSEGSGLTFSQKGVAILDGEEVFIEKVNDKDIASWKVQRGLELGDVRLLGDHRDASGRRRLDLVQAINLMKGDGKEEDFPICGVRAAREFHQSVATGVGSFHAYHEHWIRLSGVAKRSSAAHIHRAICECLYYMHGYDQVDPTTTAVGEHLSRWLVQTELAVERNPGAPDYTGLDILSGSSLQADGRAVTQKFGEWIASKLKERSAVWKQERLYQQERRLLRGKGKGNGKGENEDTSEDADPAKRRKKKTKKKDRDTPGGGNPSGGG